MHFSRKPRYANDTIMYVMGRRPICELPQHEQKCRFPEVVQRVGDYRVTHPNTTNTRWAVCHPAWAMGSYTNSSAAAGTIGNESTGGFTVWMYHPVATGSYM